MKNFRVLEHGNCFVPCDFYGSNRKYLGTYTRDFLAELTVAGMQYSTWVPTNTSGSYTIVVHLDSQTDIDILEELLALNCLGKL